MCEFASLERCAAYVAARAVLTAVQRAAPRWPEPLGHRAHRGALDTLELTAQAAGHGHDSAGRRHCLREAITAALGVAATIDAVRAMGHGGDDLADLQRVTGRTIALLGMFLHAGTALAGAPERARSEKNSEKTKSREPTSRSRRPTGSRDMTTPLQRSPRSPSEPPVTS
ncbi:MAG TPA: hypothetical protein VF516_06375 [Kofleriaceae bacterium]